MKNTILYLLVNITIAKKRKKDILEYYNNKFKQEFEGSDECQFENITSKVNTVQCDEISSN